MAEIQYRCEVAEKKRARSAFERFQEEKRSALEKAAYEAEKRKQEEMRVLTENLTKKLRNEAALQREIALGEALAVARVMTKKHSDFLCRWKYPPKVPSHWLLRGHMTSNNETVSRQKSLTRQHSHNPRMFNARLDLLQ